MRGIFIFVFVTCFSFLSCDSHERSIAITLDQELQIACSDLQLWPGYDPISIPLAIFDGSDTYLFRHSTPPAEFQARGDHFIFHGRHTSIVANSSASIGEIVTATVILDSTTHDSTLMGWIALIIHEGFHVFQGTTKRRWEANEADLFTYPMDQKELLTLRRLESEALRRSLEAQDPETRSSWVGCALKFRGERFAKMDPKYCLYERGVETKEGTATYVESMVSEQLRPEIPESGFDAEDVRSRAYQTGAAWCLLLDQFQPDWWEGFDQIDTLFLDEVLKQAMDATGESAKWFGFTSTERVDISSIAQGDIQQVHARRMERRRQFESAAGWRITFEADENLLWPQGFDPLNVHLIDQGSVLHTRFVKLGNDFGSIEVMGGVALSEGVGPHPLFNGVRSLILTGIEQEPTVDIKGNRVSIRSAVFDADFKSAEVERHDLHLYIRLISHK